MIDASMKFPIPIIIWSSEKFLLLSIYLDVYLLVIYVLFSVLFFCGVTIIVRPMRAKKKVSFLLCFDKIEIILS